MVKQISEKMWEVPSRSNPKLTNIVQIIKGRLTCGCEGCGRSGLNLWCHNKEDAMRCKFGHELLEELKKYPAFNQLEIKTLKRFFQEKWHIKLNVKNWIPITKNGKN